MDCKTKTIKPWCNYFTKGCRDCSNPIFMSDWCCCSWCEHGEFVLKQYLKLQRPRNRWWWLWLRLLSCIKCSCHAGFNVNNRPSRLLDECRISIWIQESLDISSFNEKPWIERNPLKSIQECSVLLCFVLILQQMSSKCYINPLWSDKVENDW